MKEVSLYEEAAHLCYDMVSIKTTLLVHEEMTLPVHEEMTLPAHKGDNSDPCVRIRPALVHPPPLHSLLIAICTLFTHGFISRVTRNDLLPQYTPCPPT
jgi:hypothetical protein